jgi:putrescine transport system substrate-binding protein
VNRTTHAALLGVIVAVMAVAGCSGAAPDRSRVVNVFAWAEYFPPSVIEKFEAETGLHVNYAVFDSPDVAETTISAGHSNYDIVTMNASPHLAREIPQGFWKSLDKSKIPNANNADPLILKLLAPIDPGNAHAVPWMWGTVGVLYNSAKVAARGALPANSLDMVLDKETARKFQQCGISVLDSWQDVLPMVARYIGLPQLSTDPNQLDAVVAKLTEIRPYLRNIATAGYYEKLATGDLCVALGYSGDAMVARRMVKEAHATTPIDYAYAPGAVPLYVDSMVIPADSPNAAGALAFINFMMRPEISAEVTKFIGFASGNSAAVPLLDREMQTNVIVYPPMEIRARFVTESVYTSDELRVFTRVWQRFKTGQ